MEWLTDIFSEGSIAHSILVVSAVISLGLLCNRIKVGKIALGSTWILFAGIAMANLGFTIDHATADFLKNFGLVLFVYALGLQVGPAFFSSFRKGGMKLNALAACQVLMATGLTVLFAWISGEKLTVMTGVLSGAVTDTSALGAAQQILSEVQPETVDLLATGYAVTYPMGILGVILGFIVVKALLRIDTDKLDRTIAKGESTDAPGLLNVRVTNPALFGKTCGEVIPMTGHTFVIARIRHTNGEIIPGDRDSVLHEGDALRIMCHRADDPALITFFGEQVHIDATIWEKTVRNLVTKRVLVSKPEIQGKTIASLHIRQKFDVNVTRVSRAGIELVPKADYALQMGDRVTIVGVAEDCERAAEMLGNSMKKLDVPHIFPIFFGIFLGIILGELPIYLPDMPYPIKLGLAGGPLIVAILIGRFGPHYRMVTFTTTSANLMLREVGISLFLACVGLLAGEGFLQTIVEGGYKWILWGALITIIPVITMTLVMVKVLKMDYFTTMGCVAGCQTNPIALAYANSLSSADRSSLAYTTVYPLMMFLHIIVAELIVMLAA